MSDKGDMKWYEMLLWDKLPGTWQQLSEELKDKIRKAGKAPKFDKGGKSDR